MDKSNGYEENADVFINRRSQGINGIGVLSVRQWAKTLPANATVLDVGCGTGLPISKVMVDEGLIVYGLDASPHMVQIFKQNFPENPVVCEAVEDSSFFNRQFDAIVAWGLLFLLPEDTQRVVIQKMTNALHTGGKLLFTAPSQKVTWKDIITSRESVSLGTEKYKELLLESGLSPVEEFKDEAENHYYHAVKY
jgi:2-polyprenyl-3-methyl-5-hydroxy-6-metoxy-1,4-benzoquinol methylase